MYPSLCSLNKMKKIHKEIELVIKEGSVCLYTELNDEDKLILGSNLNEVLNAEADEILSKFSKLFGKMNESKKKVFQFREREKFIENEGYQKELQKLDSEIRGHFKCELEMKILIDGYEEKIEVFQTGQVGKIKGDYKRIEELVKENKRIREMVKGKCVEIEEVKKIGEREDAKGIEGKVLKELEIIQELEKLNQKRVKKFTKAKNELESTKREVERLRSEYFELKSLVDKKEFKGFTRNSGSRELEKDGFEVKTTRVCRIPEKIDRSSTPAQKSKKRLTKVNKSSNRLDKSPLSHCQIPNFLKKKGKKLVKLSKTPKKSCN